MLMLVLGSNNMNYGDNPTTDLLVISSIGVFSFDEGWFRVILQLSESILC